MTPLLALAEVQAHIGCLENVSTETLEMIKNDQTDLQTWASVQYELDIRKE